MCVFIQHCETVANSQSRQLVEECCDLPVNTEESPKTTSSNICYCSKRTARLVKSNHWHTMPNIAKNLRMFQKLEIYEHFLKDLNDESRA